MKQKPEKVVVKIISLYPSHLEKSVRLMQARRIRKFSQLVQRMLDEAPEPQLLDENGQAAVARP